MKKKRSLILAIVLVISLSCLLSGCSQLESLFSQIAGFQTKAAVQVGEYTVSDVELNYFYIDAITDYCNQYEYYLPYLGLDQNKPLNEQLCSQEEGVTWADYFLETAYKNIRSTYALYDAAMDAGFVLPAEQMTELQNTMQHIDTYGAIYGFENGDTYLSSIYGDGATKESYNAYKQKCLFAQAYYAEVSNSFEADDSMIADYDKNHGHELNSYDFAYNYIPIADCYPEYTGVEGDDGKIHYSEEETAFAEELARDFAEALCAYYYNDTEEFDAYIQYFAEILNNSLACKLDDSPSIKKYDVLYSDVSPLFRDWIAGTDEDRLPGDMLATPYYTTNSENEESLQGYYVVLFGACKDNDQPLVNVRHILFQFEDGEDKKFTRAEMERVLSIFISGDMNEKDFSNLAKEYSEDPGSKSNGGLYENISPGQMVAAFNDWCFDPYRCPGDFGVVETEYGYHIMYFVGYSEKTYRENLIVEELRKQFIDSWYANLVECTAFQVLDSGNVNLAYTIGNASGVKPGDGEIGDIIVVYPNGGGSGENSGTIVIKPGNNATTNNGASTETAKRGVSWIAILLLLLAVPVILIVGLIALILGLVTLFLPLIVVAVVIILIIVLVKKKKNKKKAEK